MLNRLEVGVKGDLVQSDRQGLPSAEPERGLRESGKPIRELREWTTRTIEMFEADLETNLSKVSQQLADSS